jgi:hypothetical protein
MSSKEEQFRRVADIAFEVLYVQRVLIPKEKYVLMDDTGKINDKGLGYVFGFLDALLQSSKLDIRDPEGVSTIHSLLALISG